MRIGIGHIHSSISELASAAVQGEMAERKSKRMYFVREPSQAQSSDKVDAEITSLIDKATKHREQLDKLDIAFNEARVCPRASWKDTRTMISPRRRPSPLLAPYRQSTIHMDAHARPSLGADSGDFKVLAGHLLGMLSVKRSSWCRKSGMPPVQSTIRPEIDF